MHGQTVTCPLHNWRINLNDGKAVALDEGYTRRFAVFVDADGQFFFYTDAPLKIRFFQNA